MKRRDLLKATATAPMTSLVARQTVAQNDTLKPISRSFFAALPDEKHERNKAIVDCANEFCETQEAISEETIETITETGDSVDTALNRVRFGVRILNEYNITNAVDESMVKARQARIDSYTHYLPLLGSFNNFRKKACSVDESRQETIKEFLFATLAFGIEVGLWSVGAPYKMAWRGTRFISNRTFLRFAKHGCRGCVAFAMSELHWAIRASVYNADDVVTANRVDFVTQQLEELQELAEEEGYNVTIETDKAQIEQYVDEARSRTEDEDGFFGGLIPDFDFDLPDLPDWF